MENNFQSAPFPRSVWAPPPRQDDRWHPLASFGLAMLVSLLLWLGLFRLVSVWS